MGPRRAPAVKPEIETFFDGIDSRTVFAAVRDLLSEWRVAARNDGGIPALERFTRHFENECAANLVLLRHVDGDFQYEFVGRHPAILFDCDALGRRLSEFTFPGAQAYLPRYKTCIETGAPLLAVQRNISFGIPGASERLILPVAHPDGGRAVLVYLRSRADNYDLIRAVFNTSQHGVLVVNAVRDDAGTAVDLQISAVNVAGATMFGEGPDRLVGKRITELLSPADASLVWPDLMATLETGEIRVVDSLSVSMGAGGVYKISSARVGDGLAITISDLTPLQKAMRTLETQHASLVRVNAELRSEVVRRRRLEAELKQLAATDPLTGIANRRSFTEAMNDKLAAARETAALILFDIDDFKAINDRYGHPAGDAVLRGIARLVARRFDDQVVFGRLGGEEFGVFLVDRDENAVCRAAEDLRALISDASFRVSGGPISVTASFGVKVANVPCDSETLIAIADVALYRAKHEGRNRVECHCGLPHAVDETVPRSA